MVTAIENGRNTKYCKGGSSLVQKNSDEKKKDESEYYNLPYNPTTTNVMPTEFYECDTSTWHQFRILLLRFWLQIVRDRVRIQTSKLYCYVFGIKVNCVQWALTNKRPCTTDGSLAVGLLGVTQSVKHDFLGLLSKQGPIHFCRRHVKCIERSSLDTLYNHRKLRRSLNA